MKRIYLLIVICVLLTVSCATKKPIEGIELLNQPVIKSYAKKATLAFDGRIQVIAFNIERGLFWQDVAKYLKEQQSQFPATIVLIGEADRMHSRSGDVFVADELAKALNMNMVFVTEYVEYNDKTKDNQGDHGNAILSRLPLSDITVIRHTDVFSWTKWGWTQGQPRKGDRVAIGATATLPDGKQVRVYVCHLESNDIASRRVIQMEEILEDAKKYSIPVVVGGDFNELPSGVIFTRIKDYGFENTYADNRQNTGSCLAQNGKLKCAVKIDWQINRGLQVLEKTVDYPVNSKGGPMSDHAPVRAVYKAK